MAIVLTPVTAVGPAEQVTPDGCYSPVDATFRGCIVPTKGRAVLVQKGTAATVQWPVRNRFGQAIDVANVLVDGTAVLRFADALGVSCKVYEADAVAAVGGSDDMLQCALPTEIVNEPGIWRIEWGLYDLNESLVHIDRGLLSVEPSLFGDVSTVNRGPLTLGIISMFLRDTLLENDLLGEPEFDEAEIIHAMLRPIQQWNEAPPPVAFFNANTFPFRDAWLKATISELLKISAHWMMRNRLPGATGVGADDKNKPEYLQAAQMLQKEWESWMYAKKREINAGLAFGSLDSCYSHTGYFYGG